MTNFFKINSFVLKNHFEIFWATLTGIMAESAALAASCMATGSAGTELRSAMTFLRVQGRKKSEMIRHIQTLVADGRNNIQGSQKEANRFPHSGTVSEVDRRSANVVAEDGAGALQTLEDELDCLYSAVVCDVQKAVEQLSTLQTCLDSVHAALWKVSCRARMAPSVFNFTTNTPSRPGGKRGKAVPFLKQVDTKVSQAVKTLLNSYALTEVEKKTAKIAVEPTFRLDFSDSDEDGHGELGSAGDRRGEGRGRKARSERGKTQRKKTQGMKKKRHVPRPASPFEDAHGVEKKRGRGRSASSSSGFQPSSLPVTPGGTPYVPGTPQSPSE